MAGDYIDIPLADHSYQSRSLPASAQRLVNMYAVQNPPKSKSEISLYPLPGLKLFGTGGSGPCRGITKQGPHLFAVQGEELWRFEKSGTAVLLGSIQGSQPVRMTSNFSQVAIATTTLLYVWDGTSLLNIATLSDLNGAAYADGYGIFTTEGDEKFFITSLDDFTTISALDFSSADALPDQLVGCIVDHRELWLMGRESIEIWYNSGNAAFPYRRAPSGFVERGCISPGSIAKTQHSVFWLGDDLRVYRSQGYNPIPISTEGIDELVRAQNDVNTCEAFTYNQGGHSFYVLNFSHLSISFDATTGRWQERASWQQPRWRGQFGISYELKVIVGDYANGNLYELDLDTFDDNGVVPERLIDLPPLFAGERRLSVHEVLLDAESGVGLDGDSSAYGASPEVSLTFSDDGGRTFDTPRQIELGGLGDYSYRPRWHRCGMFRSPAPRFRIREPVKFVVNAARARIDVLA